MTALDDFIKDVNNTLFVHCLGEKILFKTEKNKLITGDFLSINPKNMNDILYHDDETYIKERLDISKKINRSNNNLINSNSTKDSKNSNDNDEIMYFKIEDINFNINTSKQAKGKRISLFNYLYCFTNLIFFLNLL